MSGRRGLALSSVLVVAGLVVGVAIGRSTKHEPAQEDEEPALASSRFTEELTDTTPIAAVPAPEPAPPPAAPVAPPPEAVAPVVTPAPPPAPAPAPAAPAAVAPPPPPPVVEAPPAPALAPAAPPPPPPDPYLVRQGRLFDDHQITGSSFDESDVSEYSVVPDREVTRSSFDDQDKVDDHPTGR